MKEMRLQRPLKTDELFDFMRVIYTKKEERTEADLERLNELKNRVVTLSDVVLLYRNMQLEQKDVNNQNFKAMQTMEGVIRAISSYIPEVDADELFLANMMETEKSYLSEEEVEQIEAVQKSQEQEKDSDD